MEKKEDKRENWTRSSLYPTWRNSGISGVSRGRMGKVWGRNAHTGDKPEISIDHKVCMMAFTLVAIGKLASVQRFLLVLRVSASP